MIPVKASGKEHSRTKQAGARRRRKSQELINAAGVDLKPSSYQPSKAELEQDLSVPVSLERLAKAALSGGAERRKA